MTGFSVKGPASAGESRGRDRVTHLALDSRADDVV